MKTYIIKDKRTKKTVDLNKDNAKAYIKEVYDYDLKDGVARISNDRFEMDTVGTMYARRGDTHEHRCEVVDHGKLWWPETEKEEVMVYLDFHGGRNGKRVPCLLGEFLAYYAEVR